MRAYSYVRFSTPEQLKGDSLRRQLEASRSFAEEHGLELDESLKDIGLSAYHGIHRVKGALGKFLGMVEREEIPRGSWLLVESLDRLSREEIEEALAQFLEIIRSGIVIATTSDKQVYRKGQLDLPKLVISLTIMSRAHEESAMKAQRLAAAWEEKRSNAATTPMTARCPEWLRLEDGEFKEIDERVAIVRQIFEWSASGLGKRQIVTKLSRDGIPAFRGKNGWHESSVAKILANEAVLGSCQPHRKINGKRVPVGKPIPDYYPEIIHETLFWRAHLAKEGRKKGAAGRPRKGYPNILKGLGRCECGAPLTYVNKGQGPKGGQYLVCSKGRRKLCTNNGHYPYQSLEDQIVRHVPLINFGAILPQRPKAGDNRVADLEAEIARKTKRLNDLYKFDNLESAEPHIRSLDAEIQALNGRLTEARKTAKMAEHSHADRLDQLLELIARLHLASEDDLYLLRARIAQELKRIIDRVVLNRDREIRLVLKPTEGYRAEMEFRNNRFGMLRLTDLETEEVTSVDREAFLLTQHYVFSNKEAS
jgi:DNA invertase Pin-like site-specific DNA recombinase